MGTIIEHTYVTCFFLIAHRKYWSLVFFFFLRVLSGSQLPRDCPVTRSHGRHISGKMATCDWLNMCENAIKTETKSRE